ncbi:MAG: metallophosphoesterase [Pyrinomonadaceae bacterium]
MSKTIRVVGDVHGKFDAFKAIVEASPHPVVQIGDLGIGFGNKEGESILVDLDFAFIRGNHDHPAKCRLMRQYIDGDLTVMDNLHSEAIELADLFMAIPGAASIDKDERTPGVNWWPDEEMTVAEMATYARWVNQVKPPVILSHTAPHHVAQMAFKYNVPFHSRTGAFLDLLFEIHQPKLWVFGDHHKHLDTEWRGTRFIGLGELEYGDIVDGEWVWPT